MMKLIMMRFLFNFWLMRRWLTVEAAQSESQKSRENLQGQALPAVEGGGEGGSGHDMSIPEIRGILPH